MSTCRLLSPAPPPHAHNKKKTKHALRRRSRQSYSHRFCFHERSHTSSEINYGTSPTLVSSTAASCKQWKKLSTPSDAGAGNHIATAPALMSAHILLRRLTTAQARLSKEHLPTLVSSTPAPCTQLKKKTKHALRRRSWQSYSHRSCFTERSHPSSEINYGTSSA